MHQDPVTYCNIHFDKISFFGATRGQRCERLYSTTISNSDSEREHDGNLSHQAKINLIRIVKKFVWLTHECNKRKRAQKNKTKRSLKMVTLTLCARQKHTDTEVRSGMLNQFLTELRQQHHLKNYIWKAEKQNNGNIHFHIIIDVFIHYRTIRDIWNRIQSNYGYIADFRKHIRDGGFILYFDTYRNNGSKDTFEQIRARWEKGEKENWNNPPGTEIRQIEKVRNIHAYFQKYFSKETALQPGFGRIWFASRSLTKEVVLHTVKDSEIDYVIEKVTAKKPWKLKRYDWATLLLVNITEEPEIQDVPIIAECLYDWEEWIMEFW